MYFESDVERYAHVYGLEGVLHRQPPLYTEPFNEQELLGLGDSVVGPQKARYSCIRFDSAV